MKKEKNKKQKMLEDPDRKHRFCDPGACHCCVYLGDGDFLCDEHLEIVVSDWEPTEEYMICKKRRVKNGG